jgi:exoribonuclease R
MSEPAILVLNTGKTYGRTPNGKRLLYQCIPNDPSIGSILVPYTIEAQFSKAIKNKYVMVRREGSEDGKGTIEETLGNVDEYLPFSEYQIRCRNLNVKMSDFTKAARQSVADNIFAHIPFDSHPNIFSIDPEGCEDIDDAFSVKTVGEDLCELAIYIANVPIVLEAMGLWPYLTSRTTTIYLPDRKYPMLPTRLSEDLCSLKASALRVAFVMTSQFYKGELVPGSTTYKTAQIRVKTNYAYEDKKLLKEADYKMIYKLALNLGLDTVSADSHDVVATLMKFMNCDCARILKENDRGIFRNMKKQLEDEDTCFASFSPSTQRALKTFESASYGLAAEGHAEFGGQSYVHITSPIRRAVDIINMSHMLDILCINCHKTDTKFAEKVQIPCDYLNAMAKAARKVQMDCELYMKVIGKENLDTIYTGIVVENPEPNRYTVFLEELKIFSRIKTIEKLDIFSIGQYKIFVFDDESRLQKKIRVQKIAI